LPLLTLGGRHAFLDWFQQVYAVVFFSGNALGGSKECSMSDSSKTEQGQTPNRRDILLASTALAAASIAVNSPNETAYAQSRPAPKGPPNIVYFLVDNLGYGELGCYGGGILRGADTKRIDAFAGRTACSNWMRISVRFTIR